VSLEQDLKKIKDARLDIELLNRQNDKLCEENNAKIGELKNDVASVEDIIEEELKASGEKKLECKLGYCSFRTMPDKWDYGINEETLDEILKIYPETATRYFKTITTLIKTNIKEDILSGKIGLSSVKVTPQEPKFSYKIK